MKLSLPQKKKQRNECNSSAVSVLKLTVQNALPAASQYQGKVTLPD